MVLALSVTYWQPAFKCCVLGPEEPKFFGAGCESRQSNIRNSKQNLTSIALPCFYSPPPPVLGSLGHFPRGFPVLEVRYINAAPRIRAAA